LKVWRLPQAMRIYPKNNPTASTKFHPDPIWNYVVLGFFEECPQQEQ